MTTPRIALACGRWIARGSIYGASLGVRILGIVGLVLALGALPAAAESTLDVVKKRFDNAEAMYEAFFASRCAGMTRDASALAAVLASRNKQADYLVLPQTISREPLGLYVRGGDNNWSDIVRWSFHAMLVAEELNLGRNTVVSERQSPDPDVRSCWGRRRATARPSAWRRTGPTTSSGKSETTARVTSAISGPAHRSTSTVERMRCIPEGA